MNRTQYVPGLDLLRFCAAFLVVIYHLTFWSWAYPQGQIAQASGGVADFQSWAEVTSAGWIGVQIFFVISGFVIALSAEHADTFRFAVSRIVRLVPGVVVCATLTLVAWLFVDRGDYAKHVIRWLRSIAFYPLAPWIDSVYWTLAVEVCFYSVVLLLIAVRRFHWMKQVMCAIGMVSVAYWIAFTLSQLAPESSAHRLMSRIQWSRVAQLALVHHGVFFAIGVLLWFQLTRKKSVDQIAWLLFFAFGACLQIVAESSLHLEKTGLYFSPVLPCLLWLGSMVLFCVSVALNRRVLGTSTSTLRSLRRIGLMTYPLYLLHNVLGGALLGGIVSLGVSTTLALLISIACVVVLTWWVSAVAEPALQRRTRSSLESLKSFWPSRLHRKAVAPSS